MKKIIIIGAGIAGMAAAAKLVQSGFSVEVFEAKKYAGGRCFSVKDVLTNDIIDNGQHVFVNAYNEFFQLLNFLDSSRLLHTQTNLSIVFYDGTEKYVLEAGKMPGKLALLEGLMKYNALDNLSKLSIIRLLATVRFLDVNKFQTAIDLLKSEKQTEQTIKFFWEPIILATLNQSVQFSSAKLFINVIKKVFEDSKSGRMVFARCGLSELFENFKPKINNFEKSDVHFENRISKIFVENNKITKVLDSKGIEHKADYYISALPPKPLANLLRTANLQNIIETNYDYSTILSCYLWTDIEFFKEDFIGFINANSDWVFNKRKIMGTSNEKYPFHYSFTISNANHLANEYQEKLIEMLIDDMQKTCLFNDANVLHWRLLIDKRATISITPESDKLRPSNNTSIDNLFIAGDWTQTGLPATIEGAAISGASAAELVK